jgi:hypothetical protein
MRIEIAEIENRNIYRVWHDGAVLIEHRTRRAARPHRRPRRADHRHVGSGGVDRRPRARRSR